MSREAIGPGVYLITRFPYPPVEATHPYFGRSGLSLLVSSPQFFSLARLRLEHPCDCPRGRVGAEYP